MNRKQGVSKAIAIALAFLMLFGAVPVYAANGDADSDIRIGLPPEYAEDAQDVAAPEGEFTPSEPSGVMVQTYIPGIMPFSTDPDDMRDLDASVFADLGLPVSDGETDALPALGPVAVFGADNEIYVHASSHRGTHLSLRRAAPIAEGYGFTRCAFYPPNVVFGAHDFAQMTGSDRFRNTMSVLGNNASLTYERLNPARCERRTNNVLWAENSNTPRNLVYVSAIELNLNDPTGDTAGRRNFVAELQIYRHGTYTYRARLEIFRISARTAGGGIPAPPIANHRTLTASYNLGVVYDFTRNRRFGAANEMMEFDAITDIAVGDLNADGIDDIAVRFARNSVRVIYGTPNGVDMPHREINLGVEENTNNVHTRWMSIPIVSLDISDLRGDGEGHILSMAVGMSAYRHAYGWPLRIGGSGSDSGADIRLYASGPGESPALSRVFTHTIATNHADRRPLGLNLTGARVDGRVRLVAAGICNIAPGESMVPSRNMRYFIFDFEDGRFRVLRDNNEIANGVVRELHDRTFFPTAAYLHKHKPPVAIAAAAMDGIGYDDTIMIGGYFYTMNAIGNTALLNRVTYARGDNQGRNVRMSMRHNHMLNQTRRDASRLWLGEVRVGLVSYRGQRYCTGREQILMVVGSRYGANNYHFNISVAEKLPPPNPARPVPRFFDANNDGWVIAQETIVHQAEVHRNYPRNQGAFAALALPDAFGDTVLARFTGQAYRIYTNPFVKAVLIAAPMFPELTQFGYRGGSTSLGRAAQMGHGVTVGAYVGAGVYASVKISAIVAVELELSSYTKLSAKYSHMWNREISSTFTTSASSDNVIVSVVPYLLFIYEVFDPVTRQWAPMMVTLPEEPNTTIMDVTRFDAIAMATEGLTPLRVSNGGNVIVTTPGDPESYVNAFANSPLPRWTPLDNPAAPGAAGGWHPANNTAPGSSITIRRNVSHNNTHNLNINKGINFKAGVGGGIFGNDAKAGIKLSAGYSAGYILTHGRSTAYSGTVEFLPRVAALYGFEWRFGYTDYNGTSVLGFETRNVIRGPRHPHSLEIVNFGQNFIDIEWQGSAYNRHGIRTNPAHEGYFVYIREQGRDNYRRVNNDLIPFAPGGMSHRIDGLVVGGEYEIAIRRWEAGAMSLFPAEWRFARTFIAGEAITAHPQDYTAASGEAATFTASANVNGDTGVFEIQWQRRTPGEDWVDIPGANAQTLTFNTTLANNGDQFRASMRRRGASPFFTQYATLTVLTHRPTIEMSISSEDITVGDTVTLTAELLNAIGDNVPASSVRFDITTRYGTYSRQVSRITENRFSTEWTPIVFGEHTITAVFSGNELMARATATSQVDVDSLPSVLTLVGTDSLLTGDDHDLQPLLFIGGIPHPINHLHDMTVGVYEYTDDSQWITATDGFSIRDTTFTANRAGRFRIVLSDGHFLPGYAEVTVHWRQVVIRPADVTVYADDEDNVPGRQFDFVVEGHLSQVARNSLLPTLSVESDGPGSQESGEFPLNIVQGPSTQLVLLVLGQNYGNIIFDSGTYTVLTARAQRVYGLEVSGMSAANSHTFAAANLGYRARESLFVQLENTGNVPTRDLTISLSGEDYDSFIFLCGLPDDEYLELLSIDAGEWDFFEIAPVLGLAEGVYSAIVTIENENGLISESFTVSFTVGPPVQLGGAVTIAGVVMFGETLTANVDGLTTVPAGRDTGAPAFQWNRAGVPIPGAVNEIYTATRADVGQVLTVTVTTLHTVGEVTSAGTVPVVRAPAPPIIFPAYGSDIFYGQVLSYSELLDQDTRYGTFAWANPDYLPAAGDEQDFAVIFTPNASALAVYNFPSATLTGYAKVDVSPVQIINVTNFAQLEEAFAYAPTDRAIAVRLMNDIAMSSGITIDTGTDITLINGAANGTALTNPTTDRHFTVSSGAALTLGVPDNAPAAPVANNFAVTRTTTGIGGGIGVIGGTLVMHGGTIRGNRAQTGGGVFVNQTGAFTMYGGAISGNAASDGGGLFIGSDAVNMRGGSIRGNTASRNGGGAALAGTADLPASFNMYAGEIVFNLADNFGGGVSSTANATFNHIGGIIVPNFDVETEIPFTVTLVGGGTGASYQPFAVAGDEIDFHAGTRRGYVFENWTMAPANLLGDQAENTSITITMPDADVAATANWTRTPPAAVTIEAGGEGATAYPNPAHPGDTVTLDAGTHAVYYFAGWTSEDVTITGNSFTMPAAAVTVTATWTATPTFAVTIEGGGTGAAASPNLAREGVSVALNAGTRAGYCFVGWTSTVTIENAESPTDATFTMPGTDVTVTAEWERTILICCDYYPDCNCGVDLPPCCDYYPDCNCGVDLPFCCDYYPYCNCDVDLPFCCDYYPYCDCGVDLPFCCEDYPDCDCNGNIDPTEFFAITIIGGGAGAFATPSPAAMGATVEIFAGIRDGYVFANWTSSPATLFTSPGAISTTFTMPDEAVTVTANWELGETFTVTFNPQGDAFTTTPPAITITSGSAIGILPAMPTEAMPNGISKEGYRFTGWFAYVDGDFTRIHADFIVTGPIELIATWRPMPSNFRVGSTTTNTYVTSEDATRIARWLVAPKANDICILAADINGDGYVDIDDLILLARWLVGHNVRHYVAR